MTMTNGDKIRAMTDEELAYLLETYDEWTDDGGDITPFERHKIWLSWLKEEADA